MAAKIGSHVILIDPFLSGNSKFQGSVEEAGARRDDVVSALTGTTITSATRWTLQKDWRDAGRGL